MNGIEGYAFYGSGLTSITIPSSVTSIWLTAFGACNSLTSIVVEEGNAVYDSRENCNAIIETSRNNLIVGCSTTIIPEGVTSITSAFYHCNSLTSITIPNGVTRIVDDAFDGCSNLTSVIFSESVTEMSNSFNGCSNLASIICKGNNPPIVYADNFFSGVDRTIPLYVPKSSISAYQSDEFWGQFTNIQAMPETITINQYGSGTYCSEHALDFSEVEGLKAYAATGYKTSTGIVTLTRVMTSQPGMGLFLKGEEGEYIVPVLESTDENSLNMLVGLLESTELNGVSDDGLYYNYRYTIHEGDEEPMFYRIDEGYEHGAGKAYLQIPVAWMPAEAKSISLRFDDEDGTTDIEEMDPANQDAKIIYDLMGRKVSNPQEGGVYIVNGNKIVW